MARKEFKDYTYEELCDWIAMSMHLALLEGGGKQLRSQAWVVANGVQQWHEHNVKKA